MALTHSEFNPPEMGPSAIVGPEPLVLAGRRLEGALLNVLPADTLFAVLNRLLRSQFPVWRDRHQMAHVVSKGLAEPRLNKSELGQLPGIELDMVASALFFKAAVGSEHEPRVPVVLDALMTLVWAIDSLCQFDPWALVYEDLAAIQAQGPGHVPAFHFDRPLTYEGLATILTAQGVASPGQRLPFWTEALASGRTTGKTENGFELMPSWYWCTRKLGAVLPWAAVCRAFDEHVAQCADDAKRYPYLYRFCLIAQRLEQWYSQLAQASPQAMQEEALQACAHSAWVGHIDEPTFEAFLKLYREEGPVFSARAGVAVPIQRLVLVEGSTEEVILPAMASVLGLDAEYNGIHIEAVGGKNQMLSTYVHHAEQRACPITVILDADARALIEDLAHYQRPRDQLICLEQGELEDLYPPSLIAATLNAHYDPHPLLEESDILTFAQDVASMQLAQRLAKAKEDAMSGYGPQTNNSAVLKILFNHYGWRTFDKVRFAQQLAQTLSADFSRPEQLARPDFKPLVRLVEQLFEPPDS